MCNLYRVTTNVEAMRRLFRVDGHAPNLPLFGEIYPKREAPIIRADDAGVRRIEVASWGTVGPAVAEGPVTNIRNLGSSFWRKALRDPTRRCLVPVSPFANSGVTRALLAGEGYFPGDNVDSDPFYTLTLSFDDGQALTGQYVPTTNTFVGGSSITSGNSTFSLIEFSYRRFLGDAVQANVATPGGDGNDYVGNFRISAVSGVVPEPATWGLMIAGFVMVGASMRRRTANSVTA